MEYEVQFSRITSAGKLPDRFLNCQYKTYPDVSKAYMGTVSSLVEIVSPWFATSQVGQSIINTFYQNYYQGESTSDLDNFEEALKKVNENLVKITQNGETNWVGNLNAILAVVIENKILLAQTGQAEAYIFREGKTNHLTYGLAQGLSNGLAQGQVDTHPAKTFSNITSGELKSHDKVLIANPELFVNLELETLREIITLHSSQEAILQIAKILKRKKVKAVNVLILDLLTLEEASKVISNSLNDNIQLDRPIESMFVYWEKIWLQILKPIFMFSGRHLKKAGEKSLILTKNIRQKIAENVAKRKEKTIEPPKVQDKFDREFLDENANDEGLLKDEAIEYSPELNVHYYEQKQKQKEHKVGIIANNVLIKVIGFFSWTLARAKDKKARPYFFVGAAIVILLIIVLIIGSKKHDSASKITLLEAQTILKNAESSAKDAKQAVLSGDQEKAKASFIDCVASAQKIKTIELVKSDAKTAYESCITELDKLTATTRFSILDPVVTGQPDIKNVVVSGGQAFFASSSEIFKATIAGGKIQKTATLPRNNGDIQFSAVGESHIYYYTSNQKVYDYSTDSDKLELIKTDGSWETANAASFYSGSMYLLDGIIGQIYKHSSSAAQFGAGQNYISSSAVNLKNGISLSIDGSVYVLKSDGTVIKLQKGKQLDFNLHNMPSPYEKIEKPVKVYTDADTTSIYILDAGQKRIVEIDKNGSFVHQYALPDSFNNLTDFTVSVKAKKIWVLNAGNLYEIGI